MGRLVALSGTLGELRAGDAQVPADELADDARAVEAVSAGRGLKFVPQVLLQPDAAHLVSRVVRHGREVYRPYVCCRTATVESHSCSVCRSYVRFKGLNSTKPRQLLRASTGFRANRVLGETAVTTTLASLTANGADDVTHAVLCGACDESKGEHYSCYTVSYETTDLDGEPAGERLFCCKHGLADSLEWAAIHNRSFVPPAISRLTPYCPACGAAWHACTTDARGLCVKASVAA